MKISKETNEKISKLYKDSRKSIIKIAKECGVSEHYVRIFARKNNLKRSYADYSQDTLDRAVNSYIAGERVKDILEATGIAIGTLYKELDKRQIERRLEVSFRNRINPFKKVDKEKVYELYQKNMSISEIAKELEFCIKTIEKIISTGLKAEEIQISDKYLKVKQENEICIKLAPIIVMQQKNSKISIRDVAKAFGVKEQKLYCRVAEAKKEMTDK